MQKLKACFLFLFENMILHTGSGISVSKVNNKNLKDCGNCLMKRYFLLRVMEVVDS